MGLYDLVSRNGTTSPERRGEFLRLPENAPGFPELFSRFSTVEKAVDVMSRIPEVHPDVPQKSASQYQVPGVTLENFNQPLSAPTEALFGTDSLHDSSAGSVGSVPVAPAIPTVSAVELDPEVIARNRIDAIFSARGE